MEYTTDQYGVKFSKDGKVLFQCPETFPGEYNIPNGVTCIETRAFMNCAGLTAVTIPDSVECIHSQAFEDCSALASVNMADSVKTIREEAFEGCRSLTSVRLSNNLMLIPRCAFEGCSSLTEIILPDKVKIIHDRSFMGCEKLIRITLPRDLNRLATIAGNSGGKVFDDCKSLTEFVVGEDNPNYCAIDGVLFSKDKKTLVRYPVARKGDYTIPNGVAEIAVEAFRQCRGLTGIIIPEGVETIGRYAFSECDRLTAVNIPGSVTKIGDRAFEECGQIETLGIFGSAEISGNAFLNCKSLTTISYPDEHMDEFKRMCSSLKNRGINPFKGCSNLELNIEE